MMKKVLILGASSDIGIELTKFFLKKNGKFWRTIIQTHPN